MRWLSLLLLFVAGSAHAYPQFQLSTGAQRCNECHFAPAGGGLLNAYGREDKSFPETMHPVVRTHPVTGRKSLFVNRGFTTRIEGLKKHESDALLEMLLRHTESAEFQCRFRWAKHSVAFWDNRCALHRATFDYFPNVRHGHRVQIRGDRPFLQA